MTISTPPSAEQVPLSPVARARPKPQGALKRLLFWLGPSMMGFYAVHSAIPHLILPLQLSEIDPANKVANFAIISTFAALLSLIAQPVAGAISDRTRSRHGRRAPLMLAGALVGGAALCGMAFANSVMLLGVIWVIGLAAYNFASAPQSAILPDRVPEAMRGTFAGVIGACSLGANILGSLFASQFTDNVAIPYLAFAGFTLVLVVLFILFNPDKSSRDIEVPRLQWRVVLNTFWVNPIAYPDFFWAFVGRFLLYLGYFITAGYQFYILQDYVGLGDRAAAFVPLVAVAALPGLLISITTCGWLSDRVGRRKPFIFASSLIIAVALIIPFFFPTPAGMLVSSALIGFGFGAFQAVDTALMTQVLPDETAYAKDMGIINLAQGIPTALAPAIAGVIVLTLGYSGLWPIAAALGIMGAFCVLAIRSVR